MPTKNVFLLMAACFIAGFMLAYALFYSFPDYVLPASTSEYTLVTSQANEAFATRVLFSFFVGLAFLSAPFASWYASKYSRHTTWVFTTAIYLAITTGAIVLLVLYYRSHFAEMFSALGIQATMPIPLDTIPYYRIPLLAAFVTCLAGLMHRVLRKAKTTGT
jgi:MFS family permease